MSGSDLQQIKSAARGRWSDILSASGVALPHPPHRHHPCPGCGGRDRFRFDDRNGDGTFICGQGGDPIAGDGFKLLQHVHGWSFGETLAKVAEYLGFEPKKRHRQVQRPGRCHLRYEGMDYRAIPAISKAVLVSELFWEDRLKKRPLTPEDLQQFRRARALIRRFVSQGGRLYG